MSSFGTGSLTTGGSGVTLTTFTGTNGAQAGTDGLVPGPSVQQQGYILGAGGDWTLDVKAIADPNDNSERVATTRFVQTLVANAQIPGGNANLSALGDVTIVNLSDDQFLQYDAGSGKWNNVALTVSSLTDVDLSGGVNDGEVLAYDANSGSWVPSVGGAGGGASELDDLTDVTINAPVVGHLLVHNGAGQFVNQTISSADLSDGATLATQAYVGTEITNLGLGTASQSDVGDFLASNSDLDDLSDVSVNAPVAGHLLVHDGARFVNQTISSTDLTDGATLATQAYVGTEITNLGLGTASQSDAGDFLASNASIADLSDVNTIAGIADGNVLAWNAVNSRFEFTAPAQTYTDENAQDAVEALFIGNGSVHTDITFTYDDNANTMTASVNNTIARVASPSLTGVPTAPTAALNTNTTQIATTAFVAQEITDLNLGSASLSDTTDFVASSLITLSNVADGQALVYDAVNSTFENIALSVSDLSDGGNLVSDNVNTTFTADVDFTGGAYTADTPANNAVGREIATASFVRSVVNQVGAVSQLSDLADVDNALAPADGEALLYVNANNQFESALLSTANLSDINTAGIANGNVLTWDNVNSEFVASAPAQTYTDENAQDAINDLFVTNNPAHTGLSFTYDDNANTMSVAVTGRLADIESMNATLNNFIVGDGANFLLTTPADARTALGLGTASLSDAGDFLASNSSIADLSDVDTIAGIADGNVLAWNAVNSRFEFTAPAQTYTDENAQDAVEALFIGNGSVHTDITFTYDDNANTMTASVDNTVARLASPALTGTPTAPTAALNTNTTQIASTAFVAQEIADLSLGTASQSASTDFVSSSLITLTNAVDGQALIYDAVNSTFDNATLSTANLSDGSNLVSDNANTTFTATVDFTSDVDFTGGAYTADAPANNAVGREIATASFVRSVVAQVGNVSQLADLADVDQNLAPADGEALIYVNANGQFESVALSTSNLSDAVNLARLNQSGTFAQQMTFSAEAQLDGGIDVNGSNFTVDSATGDVTTIGDIQVGGDVVVDGNLTISGTTTTVDTTNLDVSDQIISLNNGVAGANTTDIGLFMDRGTSDPALIFWDEDDATFKVATHTGAVDSTENDFSSVAGLTLAPMQVKSPVVASDDNSVATTEWVYDTLATLSTDDLSDVTITQAQLTTGQTLRYNGGAGVFENSALSADDLSDISVGANIDGQVLRNNGAIFVNSALAHTDLSDHADYAPLASPNLTGNPTAPDQNALTNNSRIANTRYVDSAVTAFSGTLGTASSNDTGDFLQTANNLSDLNNAGTARTNLGLGTSAVKDAGTGADEVLLLTQANTLPALSGSALTALGGVTTHSDVNITNPSEGQTLRYDALAGDFENSKLSVSDLSNGSNVALITGATFTGDLRASTQGADDSSTLVATTAFVQQEIGNASVGDLDNVSLTNTQAGEYLRYNGANFVNVDPVVADISDAGSSATKDAGTGADEVLLLAQAGTLPALDGTALTGVLKSANNLSDVANTGTARTNLGLGTASTLDSGDFLQSANDLSDLSDAGTARTNLGLGTSSVKDAGTGADEVLLLAQANVLPALDGTALTGLLKAASNLSDVANAVTARTNLGLTSTATTAITALLQAANALSEIAALGGATQATARTNLGLGTVSTLDTGTNNGDVPVLGAQGLPAVSGENLTSLGSVALHSDVNTTNIADGEFLRWDQNAGEFQPASAVGISTEDALDFVGTALENGSHSGVTGITFTHDDPNNEIDLTLEVQTSDLTDISANAPSAGQVFVYDANNSEYVPSALSADTEGVGTSSGNIPVLSDVSITRTNDSAELQVYGRVVEVIDYGTVDEVFDANTDWSLDFNGTGFADVVVYSSEDYGTLVV